MDKEINVLYISNIYDNDKIEELYNESIYHFIFKKDDSEIGTILYETDVDVIVSIGNIANFRELNELPYYIRLKWIHYDRLTTKIELLNDINATFERNLTFKGEIKKFSFFTCAFKTTKEVVLRLYESLKKQTYNNWDWWILDDSPDGYESYFMQIIDPRIHIIRNIKKHGNIGFNKHIIAMIADGDYLVEIDHDDELTKDCLEYLLKAFEKYADTDFVYSYTFEETDGEMIDYEDGFALGLGEHRMCELNGEIYNIPVVNGINCLSMRDIVSMPNHVRCWKKDFYHKIGGHNSSLSVCDDMELLIRTFLYGKICQIPKILYIQHEGSRKNNNRGSTTQADRFKLIKELRWRIRNIYDQKIHDKIIEMGIEDPYWNDEGYSDIWNGIKNNTININYTLEI